jgi:hypothetical protein
MITFIELQDEIYRCLCRAYDEPYQIFEDIRQTESVLTHLLETLVNQAYINKYQVIVYKGELRITVCDYPPVYEVHKFNREFFDSNQFIVYKIMNS